MIKDAPLMLEWMHDESVVRYMRTDFASKTLEDCETFIMAAQDITNYLHLAIVNDIDEYMGTVSLKNINSGSAEFGITVRSCAMGCGYAKQAMDTIIKIGFEEMGLEEIYWCVAAENKRAIRFYEKNNFQRISASEKAEGYTDEEKNNYFWYMIKKNHEI